MSNVSPCMGDYADMEFQARLQAQADNTPPPLPQRKLFQTSKKQRLIETAPAIITTAPTGDINIVKPAKRKSRAILGGRIKSSSTDLPFDEPPVPSLKPARIKKMERRKTMTESGPSGSKGRVTFDEPERPLTQAGPPPEYGDESGTALALPINRLSESSRSDGSLGDHGVYGTTTTTTHTVHTTTTFFRLPRRRKATPMFDLSHLPQKSTDSTNTLPPRASASSTRIPGVESAAVKSLRSPSSDDMLSQEGLASPMPSPSRTSTSQALARSSTSFAVPGAPMFRNGSTASTKSSPTRSRLGLRGRSSTLSSLRNMPSEDALPTPSLPSTRTSTSAGRKSFGDLFSLSARLRHNSEPQPSKHGSGFATPGSSNSKNNSVQLAREPVIILPERLEDDTPAKYLVRLEEAVNRGVVASVLSKGTDPFSHAVLRSYMRGFGFFGDPMDMAIRKLLMEVELPKETQQIDRCLQSFAARYHECNPGIYTAPEQAYFVAFSILILHTDVFNKNNKYKMQRSEYIKLVRAVEPGVFNEILECFYDNISYTPFIHVEDDLDINGERIIQHKTKKRPSIFGAAVDPSKRPSKEPVDPYTLIIDSKLDTLRPNLKDVMQTEEHYSYLGTAPSLNLADLQKTFFRTGILQIVSARSRPDAFMSDKTVNNPDEAQAGIVDIKITKVGLLWRKDVKKKKTRSPWQEWGAILTGAQLYFFRNTTWIKNLMHQLEQHIKQGHDGTPVIFKPPLDQFKPDSLMSTDDAVALFDLDYKKHKNAFVFVRHGGFEETFLADNEQEMNDWLAKLNYAAAFRTSGVRMRGVVGGNYDGQRTRGIRRLDQKDSRSIQTPTGEVTIVSGKIDSQMAQDILAARREIMLQKIREAEEKLDTAQKHLDAQLRNARHLQILAPVQQKTRQQVVMAAGRMAAQLQWGRMEIWRLRCHKDILTMDLEEESGSAPRIEAEIPASDKTALPRLASNESTIPRSPMSVSSKPTSAEGEDDEVDNNDDIFLTPPTNHTSSFAKTQASWELPPLDPEVSSGRKLSVPSIASPGLTLTPSKNSLKPVVSPDSQRSPSPNIDAAEQAVLEQSGFVMTDTPDGKRPTTAELEENKDTPDKMGKGNIRRSLHRTLREAHVPSHHRSRKGKDSSSSAGLSEESKDDILTRGTGSFVVHGKKASVITFGTEFQGMSPDERLRLRMQPHIDEAGMTSPAMVGHFQSILAEPYEYHERHESNATTSTATARSFRELHKKLAAHSSNSHAMDDEDSDGSYEDGRKTPLPPVTDDEDEQGSHGKQAAFYTPEASNSPNPSPNVVSGNRYASKQHEEDDLDETVEDETLSTVIHMVVSQP